MDNRNGGKILTVAIPCYNSESYMGHAIESALAGGEKVEVLIVDDGSKDRTAEIGKGYEKDYPHQVRYIYKENGGHGDAVMCGLKNATGLYYKVLDSDDWLDAEGIVEVVEALSDAALFEEYYDMFICNYVYEKADEKRKVVMDYVDVLPEEQVFDWREAEQFKIGQYILMHSVIYRTELLRECGLHLPKHTFYVDNIYVYRPLPYVKKMYYKNIDLYHYFIGREDQSVNEQVMIKRIDQQLFVTNMMSDMYDVYKIEPPALRDYMAKYLTIMYTVPSALLVKDGSDESHEKKEKLWDAFQNNHPEDYALVRKNFPTKLVEKDGWMWDYLIEIGYFITQKIYHFN